jgi:hypothetical protein
MAIKDALNGMKMKHSFSNIIKDYSVKEKKFQKIIDEKLDYYAVRSDFMKKSKEASNYMARLYGASKELIEEIYSSMHNMKTLGNELFNEYALNPLVNRSIELIYSYLSIGSTAKETDYMGELEKLFCPNKLDEEEPCFSEEHDSLASMLDIKMEKKPINKKEEITNMYNMTKSHIRALMLLGSKMLREYHDIDYKIKNNGNPVYMRHIKRYEEEAKKKIQQPLVNQLGEDILIKKK